jgi:hypothetical protein
MELRDPLKESTGVPAPAHKGMPDFLPAVGMMGWQQTASGVLAVRQRVSFRSVREAVEAARDGDQILLLRGIHNGMGCEPSRCHLLQPHHDW